VFKDRVMERVLREREREREPSEKEKGETVN